MSVKRGREASSGQAATMGIRESGIGRMCSPSVRVLYFVRSALTRISMPTKAKPAVPVGPGAFYVL